MQGDEVGRQHVVVVAGVGAKYSFEDAVGAAESSLRKLVTVFYIKNSEFETYRGTERKGEDDEANKLYLGS